MFETFQNITHLADRFTDQFKINASSAETIEAGYKQIAMVKKLGDTAATAQTWLKANHHQLTQTKQIQVS